MRSMNRIALAGIVICFLAGVTMAQEGESETNGVARTMRPIVRGRHFAVAAMKAEATRAAERILERGGNAFDAIVAGQAVLGIVDAAMNGVGSDAVLLVYDAKTKKVYSIDAEGTAPRLATIAWYKEHNGGKLPVNDSLLSGTVPGCIDAWYILLDRWGTMSFAQVLAEAIETDFRWAIHSRARWRRPKKSASIQPARRSIFPTIARRKRVRSFAIQISRER
jgi:gamma-glutamyltranspeptidase/glutathione hydrolase